MTQRMATYRFADSVAPGDNEEYSQTIQQDATIERLDVRLYNGPELDLRIKPFVVDGADRRPLINYNGKQYIDGNDDSWPFRVSEPIEEDEEIVVEVENLDPVNEYNFAVNAVLDEAGGIRRVLSEVFN